MPEVLERSREIQIEDNLGLVHSCAHRFKGRGIEYEDLFQAGCMGLVKAADAFDTSRGVKFSTYAVPVILGEMKRLFRDGGSVKVSRTLKELSIKVSRQRDSFLKEQGREPSISELAALMEVNEEQITEALNASLPTISLAVSEEDGGGEIDIPVPPPEEELADKLSLIEVLKQLEEKDQRLITLRYYQNKTQTQTANELGMTQVQVSRREKKILTQLRRLLL